MTRRDVRVQLGKTLSRVGYKYGVSQRDLRLILDRRPQLFDDFAVQLARYLQENQDLRSEEFSSFRIPIPALSHWRADEIAARCHGTAIKGVREDASPETSVVMKLVTVMKPGEMQIDRAEFWRRIALLELPLLGLRHWNWVSPANPMLSGPERSSFLQIVRNHSVLFPGTIAGFCSIFGPPQIIGVTHERAGAPEYTWHHCLGVEPEKGEYFYGWSTLIAVAS